jgi:uncharacterized protein (TIGR01777 family)
MKGRKIILAGGSGFIGSLLARRFSGLGARVVVLTRSSAVDGAGVESLQWDGCSVGAWRNAVDGAEAVINLAGRSVNCRYTSENMRQIIDSRVNAARALGQAVSDSAVPPRAFIQAAGQAIYGDFGAGCCDEQSPPGEGFLVETCRLWEGELARYPMPGTRRVVLRIGFVLGTEGGALPTLARLAKWGLGGAAGNGRQMINWIHANDLVEMIVRVVADGKFEGTYNACGPNPVSNAEFMKTLRQTLHRPWSPPAPALAVRAGAWLMGSNGRLALTGRCCVPKRLLEQGFTFAFTDLRAALEDLCGG